VIAPQHNTPTILGPLRIADKPSCTHTSDAAALIKLLQTWESLGRTRSGVPLLTLLGEAGSDVFPRPRSAKSGKLGRLNSVAP
jgi:hypothetical protein